jgi:hypothetical protein
MKAKECASWQGGVWAGRGVCGQAGECERKQGIVRAGNGECASWQGGLWAGRGACGQEGAWQESVSASRELWGRQWGVCEWGNGGAGRGSVRAGRGMCGQAGECAGRHEHGQEGVSASRGLWEQAMESGREGNEGAYGKYACTQIERFFISLNKLCVKSAQK